MDPVWLGVRRRGAEELATFVEPQPLKAKRVGVFADPPAVLASAFMVVHTQNVALLFVSVRRESDLDGGFSCTFRVLHNAPLRLRLPAGAACISTVIELVPVYAWDARLP